MRRTVLHHWSYQMYWVQNFFFLGIFGQMQCAVLSSPGRWQQAKIQQPIGAVCLQWYHRIYITSLVAASHWTVIHRSFTLGGNCPVLVFWPLTSSPLPCQLWSQLPSLKASLGKPTGIFTARLWTGRALFLMPNQQGQAAKCTLCPMTVQI